MGKKDDKLFMQQMTISTLQVQVRDLTTDNDYHGHLFRRIAELLDLEQYPYEKHAALGHRIIEELKARKKII